MFHEKVIIIVFAILCIKIHHKCEALHENNIKSMLNSFEKKEEFNGGINDRTNQDHKFENKINDFNSVLEKIMNNRREQHKKKKIDKHGNTNNEKYIDKKNFSLINKYVENKYPCHFNDYNDQYINFLAGYNLNKLSNINYNDSNFSPDDNLLYASFESGKCGNFDNNLRIIKEKFVGLVDVRPFDSCKADEINEPDKLFKSKFNEIEDEKYTNKGSLEKLTSVNHKKTVRSKKCMNASSDEIITTNVVEDSGMNDTSVDLNERLSVDSITKNKLLKDEKNFGKENCNNYDKEEQKYVHFKEIGENFKALNRQQGREILRNTSKIIEKHLKNGLSRLKQYETPKNVMKENDLMNNSGKINARSVYYPTAYKYMKTNSSYSNGMMENYPPKYSPHFKALRSTAEFFVSCKSKRRNQLNSTYNVKESEIQDAVFQRENCTDSSRHSRLIHLDKGLLGINSFVGKLGNIFDILLSNSTNPQSIRIYKNFNKRNLCYIKNTDIRLNSVEKNNLRVKKSCKPNVLNYVNGTVSKYKGKLCKSDDYKNTQGWIPLNLNDPIKYFNTDFCYNGSTITKY